MIEMEKRKKKERETKRGREDTGEGSVERRIREVERKIEKEREGKRRNILIRWIEVREGRRKEMVEETMERIGAKISVRR